MLRRNPAAFPLSLIIAYATACGGRVAENGRQAEYDSSSSDTAVNDALVEPDATPDSVADAPEAPPPGALVGAGWAHTCASKDGLLRCWGDNEYSQVAPTGRIHRNPVPIDLRGVEQLALGHFSTCVRTSGSISCWGGLVVDRTGHPTTVVTTPSAVAASSSAADLVSGARHRCFRSGTGTLSCWGDNASGQLGIGTRTPSATPVEVAGLPSVDFVGLGFDTSFAVTEKATYAWGSDTSGLLGTKEPSTSPKPIAWLASASKIAAGETHACVIATDGRVSCWGRNDHGQLGTGAAGGFASTPSVVVGLPLAKSIGVGVEHTCALLLDGSVRCWGANPSGQLGDGTVGSDAAAPRVVSGVTAKHLAVGAYHACIVTNDDTVRCWGENGAGQLGDGSVVNRSVPVSVAF